ncbi:MAG: site-specific integrase [Clostridia bacterium]|nr:site-specific integrase [Clostridia bacterium]
MARLKAQINGKWVTSDTAQHLVDKALQSQTPEKSDQTVKDYAARYMRLYKENSSISNNTLTGYHGYLKNHIYPAMGHKDICEITVDVIQSYINDKATVYTQKTIKEHITLMAEIFDGAIEDGLIAKNPFRSKRLRILGKESQETKAYTEEEFKQLEADLLPDLTGSAQLYAALCLYTGMRRGEICALRWEDVDLENGFLHVRESIEWAAKNQGGIKGTKSNNGKRDIVIIPQLAAILERHHKKSGYLIQGARAKKEAPATNQTVIRLNERIGNEAAKHGIAFYRGSLNRNSRATVATFMNNAALDEKTIESQLGHHDIRFTRQRYMKAQAKQAEKSMGKLSVYMAQIDACGTRTEHQKVPQTLMA